MQILLLIVDFYMVFTISTCLECMASKCETSRCYSSTVLPVLVEIAPDKLQVSFSQPPKKRCSATGKCLFASAFQPANTFVAVENAHHAFIANADHPTSIRAPSNLRCCKVQLQRKCRVSSNSPMRINVFQTICYVREVTLCRSWGAIR